MIIKSLFICLVILFTSQTASAFNGATVDLGVSLSIDSLYENKKNSTVFGSSSTTLFQVETPWQLTPTFTLNGPEIGLFSTFIGDVGYNMFLQDGAFQLTKVPTSYLSIVDISPLSSQTISTTSSNVFVDYAVYGINLFLKDEKTKNSLMFGYGYLLARGDYVPTLNSSTRVNFSIGSPTWLFGWSYRTYWSKQLYHEYNLTTLYDTSEAAHDFLNGMVSFTLGLEFSGL